MKSFTINVENSVLKVFFNEISTISLKELYKTIVEYDMEKIVFDFTSINSVSLSQFLFTFLGWLQNIKINFSIIISEKVKKELEMFGFFEIYKVMRKIQYPHSKVKVENIGNCKVKSFFRKMAII